MRKIDCHTHIVNQDICDAYFSRTDSYALVMEFLPKFRTSLLQDHSREVILRENRLFFCPCIDISENIPMQLAQIEPEIEQYRIVGLKIFLTYQSGRANDEKMMPIYNFASKHHLSITFHTGSCSLVLPTDNDLEGSNAIYIQKVAQKFPDVNFIVAHMDDPRYNACIPIVHQQENMFTDFSGAYEPGTPEGADMQWAINTFATAIQQFPDTYRKILYGTDFCPPINLSAIEEYHDTISSIFTPEQANDIYFSNALQAFPLLKKYIHI